MKLLIVVLVTAGAVQASECPHAPDHSAAVDTLIAQVQAADNQMVAQEISNEMWAFWADAPDETAQEILDRGMRKRSSWDLLGAREEFDRLVRYCPKYAEGYN